MHPYSPVPVLYAAFLAAAFPVFSQKRCDLYLRSTPNVASSACLDLEAMVNGAPSISIANNSTRIHRDGIRFCKNAFEEQRSSSADVVYIMDNSGSMNTGDPSFCTGPGDPFRKRGEIVKRGMELQRELAVHTTAGFISFSGDLEVTASPADISQSNSQGAANLATLEDSVVIDTNGGVSGCLRTYTGNTKWSTPLTKALGWLGDTSVAKTGNRAIILISDGAVSDYYDRVKPLIGQLPPVYGIHLGDTVDLGGQPDQASIQLRDLTQRTGGAFYRVTPTDTTSLRLVMEKIISSLVTTAAPKGLSIENLTSHQTSVATSMSVGGDGNLDVTLDSILGLKPRDNSLRVTVSFEDTAHTYAFDLQMVDWQLTESQGDFECYDLAGLTLLNSGGGVDPSYSGTATSYGVQLTRAPSDLQSVSVNASSFDSAQGPGWGDSETVDLPAGSETNLLATQQGPTKFDGRSSQPQPWNGILEADAKGKVQLDWVHPRDSGEYAHYQLAGFVTPPLELDRLQDVTRGSQLDAQISNPVVVRAGVLVGKGGDPLAIVSPGTCMGENCGEDLERLADFQTTPTFIFKTLAPFSFSYHLFDQLGQFVGSGQGGVNASEWAGVSNKGDSSRVALSLIPVAQDGQQLGTGVYILKLTLSTESISGTPDAQGNTVRINGSTFQFLKQFGYIRDSR